MDKRQKRPPFTLKIAKQPGALTNPAFSLRASSAMPATHPVTSYAGAGFRGGGAEASAAKVMVSCARRALGRAVLALPAHPSPLPSLPPHPPPPAASQSFEDQNAYFEERKASWGSLRRFLHSCGRFLLLNVLVEELVDVPEEPLARLEGVYNLMGLIEALLLSMAMSPLQAIQGWAREGSFPWGLSPLQEFCQKLAAYSLLICMGGCLINLFLITSFYIYLNAIHDTRIRLEVKLLPIYGLPFLFFLGSVFSGLVWTVCYVTITVGWELAMFSVVVISFCSLVGLPLLAYMFFWRLPTYRRGAHASKEPDAGREGEELLRKLRDVVVKEMGRAPPLPGR